MSKFIAMTDLHLGQHGNEGSGQYSVLAQASGSPEAQQRAETAQETLADRVKDFADGDPVTLVLTGDVLDLSLAFFHDALSDFVALLRRLPAVKRVVWVVGNHDHHVWTLHCELEPISSPLRVARRPSNDAGCVSRRPHTGSMLPPRALPAPPE